MTEKEIMQQNKVDAIFALRDAAEQKVRAELAADKDLTMRTRDALLDAKLELEAKTQDAIEVCHECDHPHASHEPHVGREGNVIAVEFRQADEADEGA